MKRLTLLAALFAVLFAAPALAGAFKETPGGDDLRSNTISRNAAGYARFTDGGGDGATVVKVAAGSVCRAVFTSNVADNADHDGVANVYECPAGATAHTSAGCKLRHVRDVNNSATANLTGNPANGLDMVTNLWGPVIAFNVTTPASQTSQAEVICR